MKRPKRKRKTESIRIDPYELEVFRDALKANPEFGSYAQASQSEVVRLALALACHHVRPDVYALTLEDVNHIVDEAVRINIGEVAQVLGGVAQMGSDKTISVMRPGAAQAETFPAKQMEPKAKPHHLVN